jgi:uncharacterized membrane protein
MMTALRRYLAAGLLIWVPLGVTLLIIKFLVDLMDQSLLLLPQALRPEVLYNVQIPGLGIVLTAVIVIGTGMIVTNLFGQQLFKWGEQLLNRIPLVGAIYGSVKKLTETVFSGSGKSFRRVVLVQYPRTGMWTLAFLTGAGAAEVDARTGHETVNVFVPTTPNPTSGFMLVLPRKEVMELEMSVEDALRMILSVGSVVPESRKDVIVDARGNVP